MKVIFLDVDGVLNSHITGGMFSLKKKCIKRLEIIVNETGAKLVLSSSWRLFFYNDTFGSMSKLKRHLGYRGLAILDLTTVEYFKERQQRGDEIQKWLDEHPEVTHYVILDDDGDMLPSQSENFVRTDGDVGLTDKDVEKVMGILNNG